LKVEGLGGLCCGYDGSIDYLGMKGYYGFNVTGTVFGKKQRGGRDEVLL